MLEPTTAMTAYRAVDLQVDVVMVPGVAFDRHGRRLGRGGGFYDRELLELCPSSGQSALRIGVCGDERLLDVVPTGNHDVTVDVVVTPSQTVCCRNG